MLTSAQHLLVVQPGTVLRWHCNGWRLYWSWKSRSRLGRPRLRAKEVGRSTPGLVPVTLTVAPTATAPTTVQHRLVYHRRRLSPWSAASDNVGVTGYTVYRNGVPLAVVTGASLSFSDTSVLPSTAYIYAVDA